MIGQKIIEALTTDGNRFHVYLTESADRTRVATSIEWDVYPPSEAAKKVAEDVVKRILRPDATTVLGRPSSDPQVRAAVAEFLTTGKVPSND